MESETAGNAMGLEERPAGMEMDNGRLQSDGKIRKRSAPRQVRETDEAFADAVAKADVGEVEGEEGSPLILMVDDEHAVVTLAKLMLEHAGLRVIALEDPREALRCFRELHEYISLVLLDFAMPAMNGEELFDELRRIDPEVDAILISGYADQDRIQRMLEKGLRGFIGKPYTPDRLVRDVKSALGV